MTKPEQAEPRSAAACTRAHGKMRFPRARRADTGGRAHAARARSRSRRFFAIGFSAALFVACSSGDKAMTRITTPMGPSGTSGTGASAGTSAMSSGASGAFAPNFGNPTGMPAPNTGPVVPTAGSGGPNVKMGECATALVNIAKNMPTIMFVVDGSGSMCADFGSSTRWKALRTALLDTMNGLVYKLQDKVSFGATIYDGTIDPTAFFGGGNGPPPAMSGTPQNPSCAMMAMGSPNGECPRLVEVAPALNNAMPLDMAFPMKELGGSTPTDKALNHVMDMLVPMRMAQAPDAMAKSPIYVILATDGNPNDICTGGINNDVRPLVLQAVDRGAMVGITTWVISLAEDMTLQMHLDEVAKHGEPKNPMAHTFTPDNPDELVQTLAGLLGGAVGCSVSLNGKVKVGLECMGKVELNGAKLPCCQQAASGDWMCDGAAAAMPNGWHLQDESTIELVGDTCANFLTARSDMLYASFPCEVFVPK